jgi:hypothetical protein
VNQQIAEKKVVKLKRKDGHFDGRLRARHHALQFKVSGCCSRGRCQNCMSRNCTHS